MALSTGAIDGFLVDALPVRTTSMADFLPRTKRAVDGGGFSQTNVLVREFEWQLSPDLRKIYHAATALTWH